MSYKALMLDIDGTLVPYNYGALPSQAVIEAVKKAQEKVYVTLVTGRAFTTAKRVSDALGLSSGFMVINGGAQTINIQTEKVLYEQPIDLPDARIIVNILEEEGITFYIKQTLHGLPDLSNPFTKEHILTNPYMVFCEERYSSEKIDTVFEKLSSLSGLTLHKARHKLPDKYGFNITHAKATKLLGLTVVCEQLGILPSEAIGVGDGYNDFPLLMACGLKIAMGNAAAELKEIADFIAPSVDDDGVVTVINKFVLEK